MLSTEFEPYFDKFIFEDCFLGVFSSDNYPQKIKSFQFFIVNKDNSCLPGSHWIACFLNNNVLEFFDSLGTNSDAVNFFLHFSDNYECVFNESQLQSNESSSCGQFCIYFLYKRFLSRESSLKYFLNFNFSEDLKKNDLKVEKFCKNIL